MSHFPPLTHFLTALTLLAAVALSAAKRAVQAGVELVVCNTALKKFAIDPAKLEPQARVVPEGVTELARLVSAGYAVIRY